MESGPAVFAGVACAAFGAALLLWTGIRAWQGRPVAEGVRQVTAAALTGCFGLLTACGGVWMLLSG